MLRIHPHSRAPRLAALASVAVAGVVLTACSAAEPHRDLDPNRMQSVSIVVADEAPRQQIMGEIYARALGKADRQASVSVVNHEELDGRLVDAVASQRADFVVGCTGDLLLQTNPVRAREIIEEVEGTDTGRDPNNPSLNVEVFEAFRTSLPAGTMSIDPSGAEECKDSEVADVLPQQVLPVFRSALFSRDELTALDIYTKLITSEELDRLAAEAEQSGSTAEVVAGWMGANDPGSELLGDTDSSEGDSEFGFGDKVPH